MYTDVNQNLSASTSSFTLVANKQVVRKQKFWSMVSAAREVQDTRGGMASTKMYRPTFIEYEIYLQYRKYFANNSFVCNMLASSLLTDTMQK